MLEESFNMQQLLEIKTLNHLHMIETVLWRSTDAPERILKGKSDENNFFFGFADKNVQVNISTDASALNCCQLDVSWR